MTWFPNWKNKKERTIRAKRNEFIKIAQRYAKEKSDVSFMIDILKNDPNLQLRTPYAKRQRAGVVNELQAKLRKLKETSRAYNAMLGDVTPRPLRKDEFVTPKPGERRGVVAPVPLNIPLIRGRPYVGSGRLTIAVHNDLDSPIYNPAKEAEKKPQYSHRVNPNVSEQQRDQLRRIFGVKLGEEPPQFGNIAEQLREAMPPEVITLKPELPLSRKLRLRKQLKRARKDFEGKPHKRVSLQDTETGKTLHVDKQTAQALGVDLQEPVVDIASKQVLTYGGLPARNAPSVRKKGKRIIILKPDSAEERAMQPQRTKRGAWKIKTKSGEWRWMSLEEVRSFHRRQMKAKMRAEKSINPSAQKLSAEELQQNLLEQQRRKQLAEWRPPKKFIKGR